jgi:translation initiation factor 1
MAKPRVKVVLFVDEPPDGTALKAATAFGQVAARFGMPWVGRVGTSSDEPTAVVVFTPDTRYPTAEVWTATDLDSQVNGLVARLLGGRVVADAELPAPAKKEPPKKVHTVKVSRETAGRRGKGVTVVSELPLTLDQIDALATTLKTRCGTGGTAKDGRIEIQGDHRDRITAELEKLGYKVKRAGG